MTGVMLIGSKGGVGRESEVKGGRGRKPVRGVRGEMEGGSR